MRIEERSSAKQHTNKHRNFLKEYSDEIQGICSIISVLILGVMSVIISKQNNDLAEKQLQIMKIEQKPIINMSEIPNTDGTSILSITNNGTEALQSSVYVISFINVLCNENSRGSYPVRAYFLNSCEETEYDKSNEIKRLKVFTHEYPPLKTFLDKLNKIPSEYNDLSWSFNFTYLIRITCVDIMGESNETYFVFDSYPKFNTTNIRRISTEYGREIVNEHNGFVDIHDGQKIGKEVFFTVEESAPEQVFKYILQNMRNKNLYFVDLTGKNVYLYGEYEPEERSQ